MTTNEKSTHRPGRLIQAGMPAGVSLVRIVELDDDNRYIVRPIEINANGDTQTIGEDTLVVTNLAEPSGQAGKLPADTDVVAVDIDGRWVICSRQAGTVMFPAKVVSHQSSEVYTVREQQISPAGAFSDAPGSINITARNLAEVSIGSGGAVDNDTVVLVTAVEDSGDPPTLRYVFAHPSYAKYMS